MVRIAKKLKNENEQLRGSPERRVIVLDISGLGIAVASEGDSDTAAMLDRFDRGHPSVSQIWLVTMVWASERHSYRALIHRSPAAKLPLHSDIGERLFEVDARNDVLDGLSVLS